MSELTITADAREASRTASQTLFGLFLEDLNHSVDGGLNANLVSNHSFGGVYLAKNGHSELLSILIRSSSRARGVVDGERHWRVTGGSMAVRADDALAPGAAYARVSCAGSAMLANDGIPSGGPVVVAAGQTYRLRLWLRSDRFEGALEAQLADAAGPVASVALPTPSASWSRVEVELTAGRAGRCTFSLAVTGDGHVDVDEIVLVPADHWGAGDPRWSQGVLRRDLVETLQAMSPSFMRFPGGCIVEGLDMANHYDWKRTVGPLERRRPTYNLWGARTKDGDYSQSFQIGFYEYFLLCEDLGMEAMPVVNAGLACQMRSRDRIPLGPEFDAHVQDVIDLIDWATGDPSTNEWAALRAEAGHPAPFSLRFLGIGNENFGPEYLQRFDRIRAAVESHRPGITVVVSAGPFPKGKKFAQTWGHTQQLTDVAAVVVDEHFYASPSWFLESHRRYDDYPRDGAKVFAGEYAAHTPSSGIAVVDKRQPANTFESALAEAAFLTGVERNSDVVVLTSYAPLFNRIGHEQWAHNLIGFTADRVLPSANYFVQQMFATTVGDRIVDVLGRLPETVFASSTCTDEVQFVKVVNTGTAAVRISVDVPGAAGEAEATLLTAPLDARNTVAADGEPRLVVAPRPLDVVRVGSSLVVDLPAAGVVAIRVVRS